MQKKSVERKIIKIEPAFNDVFVCKNNASRPCLEIFIQEPENIAQQNLGVLFGVFEVDDVSEDSLYVVNYLISIIKKEYFSNTKRGAIESFEASLHKANLALSKLAEHESVNWIGKLHSVCGVIEKNNLHLAQTGNAFAFLLRADIFTPVAEPEKSEGSLNPLKTFQDVLSGRLEEKDKLILTTESIFEIFSLEEIKKSAIKFQEEEFVRFLKTALGNELEKSAVLIVDLKEKVQEKFQPEPVKNIEEIALPKNVFSQKAFEKKAPPKTPLPTAAKETSNAISTEEKLQKEVLKSSPEFIDKKTGHIYIKEGTYLAPEENSTRKPFLEDYKNKILDTKDNALGYLNDSFCPIFSKWLGKTKDAFCKKPNEFRRTLPFQKENMKKTTGQWKEKVLTGMGKTILLLKSGLFFLKDSLCPKIASLSQKIFYYLKDKYTQYRTKEKKFPAKNTVLNIPGKLPSFSSKNNFFNYSSLTKILPDFSRLGEIFKILNTRKKIFLIGILFLIFIVPYFIANKFLSSEEKQLPSASENITPPVPLEKDKNVKRISALEPVYTGNELITTVNVNGLILAVAKNQVINLETKKEVPIPETISSVQSAWEMDDLNTIFFLGENKKIVSFSPTAQKFQDNNISIADDANIVSGKSYLTYAYLLDAKNNQIYRYPRAEGGFGAPSSWLKETVEISKTKDMAVSEDIFILNGEEVQKYTQGKKQDYRMEISATPLSPDKIYTKPESKSLFVLDKKNSRIAKFNDTGNIEAQFYHPEISSFANFTVSEEKNEIYLSNNTEVKKFGME